MTSLSLLHIRLQLLFEVDNFLILLVGLDGHISKNLVEMDGELLKVIFGFDYLLSLIVFSDLKIMLDKLMLFLNLLLLSLFIEEGLSTHLLQFLADRA